VNPAVAVAIILVAVSGTVGLMLLVRRWSPVGGFFADSDRGAGVFGVVGMGFAVLLAFVIFLAFESYDRARDEASREAVATRELFRTAELFSLTERRELRGQLICYARAVVRDEWSTMRHDQESPLVNGWLEQIEQTIDGLRLNGTKQRVAYAHWFDQATERRDGRRGRLAEAAPFVPPLVWLALILGGSLIIAYVCFFADRGERIIVQAMMMSTVTAMVISGLLVVRFLDRPYEDASGSIKPVEMTVTIEQMEAERGTSVPGTANACDERGRP
jgi:hypothetical protein